MGAAGYRPLLFLGHHDHADMAALAACADHAVPAYAAVEPTREQQR